MNHMVKLVKIFLRSRLASDGHSVCHPLFINLQCILKLLISQKIEDHIEQSEMCLDRCFLFAITSERMSVDSFPFEQLVAIFDSNYS